MRAGPQEEAGRGGPLGRGDERAGAGAAGVQRGAAGGESLARNLAARGELDRTIAETEAAYGKILESSQILLDVLKGEIGNAGKASEPQSTSKEKEKEARGDKHS
ncbi:microtubule nucleation factor SSNA1-like isoform X4 [Chroicocephalus ridibundus]|uniref:microtubule nucleation factor SSNA1-like isoform X4 n=1 Tax=Chroicocephalus ridibundus TaxID=1192867 RepID=UPI002FDCD3A8